MHFIHSQSILFVMSSAPVILKKCLNIFLFCKNAKSAVISSRQPTNIFEQHFSVNKISVGQWPGSNLCWAKWSAILIKVLLSLEDKKYQIYFEIRQYGPKIVISSKQPISYKKFKALVCWRSDNIYTILRIWFYWRF